MRRSTTCSPISAAAGPPRSAPARPRSARGRAGDGADERLAGEPVAATTHRKRNRGMSGTCHHHAASEDGAVADPVCGMTVDPATAEHRRAHEGKTYFFCGARCAERFEAEPARFLSGKAEPPPAGAEGDEYICPMCEGVRQTGPGTCPKCGMALEPAAPGPRTATRYTCPMHPEIVRDTP
ncbi:MAG: YHS domain-containing protein, partial [Rhodospirillaceae bacterium]|nr:YHS domain-containing protein [Rhodospirillaceae bacterium]